MTSASTLWKARPSVVPLIPMACIVFIMAAALWWFSPRLIMNVYLLTSGMPFWSVSFIERAQWIPKGVAILLVLGQGVVLGIRLSTVYELTPDRFFLHHGILTRLHDELELHRLRDYQVQTPLFLRLFGLGYVILFTRDITTPTVLIGPIRKPRETQELLRAHAEARKETVGFRELETY